MKKTRLLPLLLSLSLSMIAKHCWATAREDSSVTAPIADVHIHYKWSQTDTTTAAQALAILERHNVGFAVVIGTPAELALELTELKPEMLLAVWSPYRTGSDWSNWAYDADVLERARSALADRRYQGIGELHLIGGFAPRPDTQVIRGLFQLAASNDIPILLHTEFSQPDYLIRLCKAHPATRILWAHAGALLEADQVAQALSDCPNVWAELSARDPWRFVNNPITTADGNLLPAWQSLIERYQDRFMIGSDPVWPVDQMDQWDQSDTGWQQYARFIEFHRHWLSTMDPVIARKIGWENALNFFRRRH